MFPEEEGAELAKARTSLPGTAEEEIGNVPASVCLAMQIVCRRLVWIYMLKGIMKRNGEFSVGTFKKFIRSLNFSFLENKWKSFLLVFCFSIE